MRKAGYQSFITSEGNPAWDTPRFTGTISDSDVVIYPEVIKNTNPFNAKNIVRYMLYFPTAMFGGGIVAANEYCMPYANFLYEETKEHYAGDLTRENILTIPSIEPGFFCPKDKDIESVHFVGKGMNHWPSPYLPKDSVEITREWPFTRRGVADLLGRTKTFYSFDHFTGLTTEAKLCGCKVVLLTNYLPPFDKYEEAIVMNESLDVQLVAHAAGRIIDFFKLRG